MSNNKIYLSEEHIKKYTKQKLLELAKKNDIVLIGNKASLAWQEKLKI